MTQASRRKHHYIYKITRLDGSGRYYIGLHSTDDLDDDEYFGSGTLLAKSIRKHGKEKHLKEILEHLLTRDALKLREREIVNEELLLDPLCMNLKIGGEGNTSEDSARIWLMPGMRERMKKNIAAGHNKPETKARTSANTKRLWLDPVYRENISSFASARAEKRWEGDSKETHSGLMKSKWNDPKYKAKTSKNISIANKAFIAENGCAWTDRKHSDESKTKMSASAKTRKSRIVTDQMRQNMRAAALLRSTKKAA